MVTNVQGAIEKLLKFWRFIWHAKIGHMKQIQIRAVIFQETPFWCAQCVDHDVAVQAKTVDELIIALGDTLVAYVELALQEGREPFADLPKAPAKYLEMFKRAHEYAALTRPKVIEIEDAPTVVPEIRVLEAA